jgi:hypothetical protein
MGFDQLRSIMAIMLQALVFPMAINGNGAPHMEERRL